jgi:hypothetical protein
VRTLWPGKLVSVASLSGSGPSTASSRSFSRSIAIPAAEGSPGVKIQASVRWSSSVVAVSALKRERGFGFDRFFG